MNILLKKPPVIAIDGLSSSGKGSVSSLVASKLGFNYLNSGLLYRLAAFVGIHNGIMFSNFTYFINFIDNISYNRNKIILLNKDILTNINTEKIADKASIIASYPDVRIALKKIQHKFRKYPGLVADGRDMGTIIFPDALLKIFLTANIKTRIIRRYNQLMNQNISDRINKIDYLSYCLHTRDERDKRRSIAPLKPAKEAKIIDTSNLSIKDVVNNILNIYYKLINNKLLIKK